MSEQNNIKVTVRISEETNQSLKKLAEQRDESQNAVMRKILVDGVSGKNCVIDHDTRREVTQAMTHIATAKTICKVNGIDNVDLNKELEAAEKSIKGVNSKWN